MCYRSLTLFNCFFKPIRISWSNVYQLHVLMLTLRTHDIMIWQWMNDNIWWYEWNNIMNGKLASQNFFWKWIPQKEKMMKWLFQSIANRDWTSNTSVNYSTTLVVKPKQVLHLVLVLLLPFSASKFWDLVSLVFQGRYPCSTII